MLRARIGFLAADKDFTISDENRVLLVKVSPSTIDRLLKPIKKSSCSKAKALPLPVRSSRARYRSESILNGMGGSRDSSRLIL
jgi:hypothetical protein